MDILRCGVTAGLSENHWRAMGRQKESEDASPCPDISGDDIDDRYQYAYTMTVCVLSTFPERKIRVDVSTCRLALAIGPKLRISFFFLVTYNRVRPNVEYRTALCCSPCCKAALK